VETDHLGSYQCRIVCKLYVVDLFIWIHAVCPSIGEHAFPEIGPVLVSLGCYAPLCFYKRYKVTISAEDDVSTGILSPIMDFFYCVLELAFEDDELSGSRNGLLGTLGRKPRYDQNQCQRGLKYFLPSHP
jgi:hypothetical protein